MRPYVLLALAWSTPGLAADPPPPSTGAEMPRAPKSKLPSKEEAQVAFGKLLSAAKETKRDCAQLISPMTRLLFALSRPSTESVKQDLEGYLWLARCAEKQRYYVLLGDLGDLMVRADPKNGHPELLARAYLGLNSPQLALRMLEKADAPKDPDVALTFAKTHCRIREWAKCLDAADKTVKLVKKPKSPEGKETLNRAHKYRARALLHQGKLDPAAKAMKLSEQLGGDAADLAEIRKAMVPAKSFKALVELEHQPIVPLGIFHLMGKAGKAKALVKFFITNIGEDRQFRVEAGIDGVTSTASRTDTVLKGQPAVFELTPQLAPGFDLNAMRSARPAQLSLKVVALSDKGETVVFQDAPAVELQPRDFLPTATFVDEEKALNESQALYIAAWVTPSGRPIETFLSEAKQRSPRNTFAGEQAATIPQVRALFDTLKAKGVSYVMNPDTFSGTGYGQRARLPGDVLSSTNAQCLEGAILYAALMEAIGLQPAIILVPGHAFVAWKTSPKDADEIAAASDAGVPDAGSSADADAGAAESAGDAGPSPDGGVTKPPPNPFLRAKGGRWLYLETTMTHDASFESAVLTGGREYDVAAFFSQARALVLPELRKLGIAPQPWE